MPAKDPPGVIKHIRFGKTSPEILTALKEFPGIKSIVLHKYGKTGEHPHYHVWWESEEPLTNQTIRNRLHKLPPLKDFSGNQDWSFRNHNSWEAWATYVCANLSHEVLLEYKDITVVSEKARVITLASPLSPPTPITPHIPGPAVKSKSRMRWDERICHDAETRLGWKRNSEFSLASFEDGLAQKRVEKQVSTFMSMRLNNNEAVKYARNLLYEFGDDDVRDYMERKIWEKISWI